MSLADLPMLKSNLPALQVAIPLLGAVLCGFFRSGRAAWLLSLIISWAALLVSCGLLIQTLAEGTVSYTLGSWTPPFGIEYRVDVLNAFVLFLVSLAGAAIMIYARESVAREIAEDKQAWFYTMYLLCLTGLLGIAITGDAFNIFVFMEVSSLATYVMIALGRHRRALMAAYQYLILGTIGATFYVIGAGLLYVMTGTLNLHDLSGRIDTIQDTRAILAALAFITVGISLKLALFPLHVWLPNAYAYAPSVATSFLAGTATKVAIYLLIRFFFSVFGADYTFATVPMTEMLLVLSLAAMFGASFVALFEDNVERMLAYSSVGQIGYITLGIALANANGLTSSVAHLFNHAVIKTALFLVMGAVIYRIGVARMSDIAGIGRRMPISMSCFAIAGLALMGTPGTAGFISKWYLVLGALDRDMLWLAMLIVASSLISVVYVGRVVEVMWFREPNGAALGASDPPASMLAVIIVVTLAAVWFGFDTRLTIDVASDAVAPLLGGVK